MANKPKPYYEIWIGNVRCLIESNLPARGSEFSFSASEFTPDTSDILPTPIPAGSQNGSLYVRKHYYKNGSWRVTDKLKRKDKVAIVSIATKAQAFIQNLFLNNGTFAHLAVNANVHRETD